MNRDAAIEAGMVALDRSRYPEGDGNLETVTRQGREDLHDEVTAVIDAALPHLMGEPVGYLVVPSSGAGYPAYKTLEGASRDLPPGWRVAALVPVVEP